MRARLIVIGATIAGLAVVNQSAAQNAMNHAGHGVDHRGRIEDGASSNLPSEPGQGAFAAIAEIAAMLRTDAETDWSQVDLDGLRDHLVDMDMLVSKTRVVSSPVEGGVRIIIDLSLSENAAAGRMVRAHAPVLAAETGWSSAVEIDGREMVWTIKDQRDSVQIQALGFFGLMATGDHHRAHHVAIARGALEH